MKYKPSEGAMGHHLLLQITLERKLARNTHCQPPATRCTFGLKRNNHETP